MFKLRLKILLGIIVALFLVMLFRLGQLQIVQGDYYRAMAAELLLAYEFPPGQRGRILDRNGVILAEDIACHALCLDYRFITSQPRWVRRRKAAIARAEGLDANNEKDQARIDAIFQRRTEYTWQLARQVAEELGQDLEENVRRIRRKVQRWRKARQQRRGRGDIREQFMPHAVLRGLSENYVNSLRSLMPNTLGASLIPSHVRRYPQKHVACHIIGVTGPVFQDEEEKWNWTEKQQRSWVRRMRHNYLPGETTGKTGIEKMCEYTEVRQDGGVRLEPLLRATRGLRRFKRPGELDRQESAQNGRDVHLTIDIDLQADLTAILAGTGYNGSIVVLSVPTGEVLAMVSCPTYDLNTYRRDYKKLVGDPAGGDIDGLINTPLLNRAAGGLFPPGSTIKPVIAAAGLAAGTITPEEQIVCRGYFRGTPENPKFRCWYYKRFGLAHGPLDLFGGLKNSCNIYFNEVGNHLGPGGLVFWLRWFGFAERCGTGLGEEHPGIIASEDYLRRHRADVWMMAIGQGKFAATPLQVANAHAAIARGGVLLSPRLALEGAPPQVRRKLKIPPGYISKIHEGMHAVVHEHGGTAYKHWRGAEPVLGVEICGKTGTAEAPKLKIDTDGDGRRDTVVMEGDHAWFAGFAPYGNPQIAFAVILEYAGSGGKNAVPLAKKVLQVCMKYGYLEEK